MALFFFDAGTGDDDPLTRLAAFFGDEDSAAAAVMESLAVISAEEAPLEDSFLEFLRTVFNFVA